MEPESRKEKDEYHMMRYFWWMAHQIKTWIEQADSVIKEVSNYIFLATTGSHFSPPYLSSLRSPLKLIKPKKDRYISLRSQNKKEEEETHRQSNIVKEIVE